ncbi:MAG TPA: hypothetical protein PLP06_12235 [Saprospiraceae bacterium]|nr:hypothetical protein [Saprospiraceae bacterium]HQW96082.1 hypothetical protein [Saprospiraceae bacterium]
MEVLTSSAILAAPLHHRGVIRIELYLPRGNKMLKNHQKPTASVGSGSQSIE